MTTAPLDPGKVRDLLSSVSLELLSCYPRPSNTDFSSLYARASISKDQDTASTDLISSVRSNDSNHAILRQSAILQRASQNIAQIRNMVVGRAPVLDHLSAFWDIEFFVMPTSDEKQEISDSSGVPDSESVKIELSIADLKISPAPRPGATEAITIEQAVQKISQICEKLSVISAPGDRLFGIGDTYIGASTPEEALFIYDTLLDAGLMENAEAEARATRPSYHLQVTEIFPFDHVRANMLRRFGSSTSC